MLCSNCIFWEYECHLESFLSADIEKLKSDLDIFV